MALFFGKMVCRKSFSWCCCNFCIVKFEPILVLLFHLYNFLVTPLCFIIYYRLPFFSFILCLCNMAAWRWLSEQRDANWLSSVANSVLLGFHSNSSSSSLFSTVDCTLKWQQEQKGENKIHKSSSGCCCWCRGSAIMQKKAFCIGNIHQKNILCKF